MESKKEIQEVISKHIPCGCQYHFKINNKVDPDCINCNFSARIESIVLDIIANTKLIYTIKAENKQN